MIWMKQQGKHLLFQFPFRSVDYVFFSNSYLDCMEWLNETLHALQNQHTQVTSNQPSFPEESASVPVSSSLQNTTLITDMNNGWDNVLSVVSNQWVWWVGDAFSPPKQCISPVQSTNHIWSINEEGEWTSSGNHTPIFIGKQFLFLFLISIGHPSPFRNGGTGKRIQWTVPTWCW